MRIYEAPDYAAMSRRAANILSAHVILNPACVLGLATGSTPLGAYEQLIRWYGKGDLSFHETRTVNLDEYRGLGAEHPQSYRHFMQSNFFDHIDIRRENTFVPDGLAADPAAECARYNGVIRSLGGIDVQLLGLGHNGHIGFNEPGQAFELETHLVDLSASTLAANTRFFAAGGQVPRQALTVGIKTIMQARRILVVVSGADKADIVLRAFTGPVVPSVPASILQMHPDVTLVGDRAALAGLREAGLTVCV
jgi:glucosamine-6-phosphate deaminase